MRSHALASFFLLLLSASSYGQQVRNPKASLVDIPVQQVRLKADPSAAQSLGDHSCVSVPVPQGHFVIPHHCLSGSNGPVNPAEATATRPCNDLENRVSSGTNQWLATGNEAEADCALAQLDTTDEQHGNFGPGDFAAEAFYVAHAGPAGLPANVAASLIQHTCQTRIGGDTLLFLPPATSNKAQ